MKNMDKIGKYEFLAEPFHCDFSGRLFMGHLGNHMLNAADFHSSARGFGMKYLMTINRSWVLSRLAIEMEEMPQQYTKFNVETWVESAMRFFTSRNFAVTGADDGKVYGDCPIDKGGRVKMSDGAELIRTIDTFYNDVDINGHINSVKYIEHVLDLWDLDWYRTHAIKRFEIAYVAEAHAGDKLSFYQEHTAENEFCIRIVRTDGTECCRSKVTFVKIS